MRIGKFSETNGLSIDTIRHYMELGLIIPEKKGGQYFFDPRCQRDLEHILEFKGMGFSLNEIKTIFLYKNFGKLTSYEEDKYYQSLFFDKYKKLEKEIQSLVQIKEKLKLKLEDISAKSTASGSISGIDLKALDMLRCLKCHEKLTLHDGIISRNQIIEGKLTCECGEEYLIDSGILIVGKPFEAAPDLPLDHYIFEYIHVTDPGYLENVQQGLHWGKRKLDQLDLHKKVLLELGTGIGFFLRNIYPELPEDCLYIAVDRSLERHRFLKSLLERSGAKVNLLFICTDFLEIPIQQKSVDIVVDNAGTSNYSFEHKNFLLDGVDSLIKQDSFLLGTYLVFKNFSTKSKVQVDYRDNFIDSKIQKNIARLKFIPLDERVSGYIDKGGKFENFFVPGEAVYSYSFFGKR
ncbi:MerR family transcriptional regulator [Neobacillus sp. PS3-34]|uniref:MerR family transcriptional regulator n=1 Tax=Neobacillus sp. PS3-34 TaxID=3070678 RepID=UPI0027E03F46|nr:MerR family transcriptional regulator [Neobacillus sp. PS3-34]WML50416.1 MerR family transcriptional regulator [Neobacillus sp. PS3-34]